MRPTRWKKQNLKFQDKQYFRLQFALWENYSLESQKEETGKQRQDSEYVVRKKARKK